MPLYSTADQKCRTSFPDSIQGNSREVSSAIWCCFVPRACIPLFSSAFLASVHHPSHMAHATVAGLNLGPQGLSWIGSLLAVSARFSRIYFLHPEHRAGCVIFFPSKKCCPPFAKTKIIHIVCTSQSRSAVGFLPLPVFAVVMQLPLAALNP